jgi:myo-inositol catabolism protein IolC
VKSDDDRRLYMLSFDHRGSFEHDLLAIAGEPDEAERARIRGLKTLIYDGLRQAIAAGAPKEACGLLIDEEFGAEIARSARADGLTLAMPVEQSGRQEFDFEFGDSFGEHIEAFEPAFAKVLVRYNPEGDADMNQRQLERLKRLSDWLHENGVKFLFELLVPGEQAQLDSVDGDSDRYDAELRPKLMKQAIQEIQDFGVEVDVWKIEGVDAREDAEALAQQARTGEGREGVVCVLLGRGASDEKVDHWLRQAAPVEGFVGFAIGRSIWWDALKGYLDGSLQRDAAAEKVADNYLRFVKVYDDAESGARV